MASIRKELVIDTPAEYVWGAIRDVGAVHTRLAQQFVVDTRLEGDSRIVTFANGERHVLTSTTSRQWQSAMRNDMIRSR